jgi:hypothetical protein
MVTSSQSLIFVIYFLIALDLGQQIVSTALPTTPLISSSLSQGSGGQSITESAWNPLTVIPQSLPEELVWVPSTLPIVHTHTSLSPHLSGIIMVRNRNELSVFLHLTGEVGDRVLSL